MSLLKQIYFKIFPKKHLSVWGQREQQLKEYDQKIRILREKLRSDMVQQSVLQQRNMILRFPQ